MRCDNMRMKQSQTLIITWIGLSMIVLCSIYFFDTHLEYAQEYIFVSICMGIYVLLGGVLFNIKGMYIFEPIVLIFILYLFIFFITPLLNIFEGKTTVYGTEIMDGCQKATIIFLISWVAFLIGYYADTKSKCKYTFLKKDTRLVKESREIKNSIVVTAAVIWIFSFACGCIIYYQDGASPLYFLTLGKLGTMSSTKVSLSFDFLSNFRFCMISAWLYLFVYARKSILTIVTGFLTLEFFVLRGFRHALFVLILAPIVYVYLSKKKNPSLFKLSFLGIILIGIMGVLQFARTGLRRGIGIDWSIFDVSIFLDSIRGNFNVYTTFYGMMITVPEVLGFQWGIETIVSVVTMFIPRAIWSSKPIAPIITNLYVFVGEQAARRGWAMPNISEYYLDFGFVGCVIYMYIFGFLMKKAKELYLNREAGKHSLILYSILLPALFQVILRGYMPGNVTLLLLYFLPGIMIRWVVKHGVIYKRYN